MCLAVPGRVVRWINREPIFALAELEFDGVRRVCHMACALDVELGDYVIVHAGLAISRVDEAEAKRILEDLSRIGLLADEARKEFAS
jgi:hydrogenase expression/formation protein HypC